MIAKVSRAAWLSLRFVFSVEKKFPERYIFVQADICDPQALADIFDNYQVEK